MEFEKVIGVTMEPDKSILNSETSYVSIAETITEHMIKSRGTAAPAWRPYIMQEGVSYSGFCCDIRFDAKSFYPEAKVGDVVYAACNIKVEKDYEVWINVVGAVAVYLDGKCLLSDWEKAQDSEENGTYISLPVHLKSDTLSNLVIKTVCTEKDFGFLLNLSPPRCPSLWTSFYLVNARVVLPLDGLKKEEGIAVSPLYQGAKTPQEAYTAHYAFEDAPCYAFPKVKEEGNTYNFEEIYTEGGAAFAYSIAETDGYVEIAAQSLAKISIDGVMICELAAGESKKIMLSAGEKLLIKSIREKDAWGFYVISYDGIGLPMLDTERKNDFKFLICGPFFQKGLTENLPPEYADNVFQPFPDGKGGKVFWRFKNAYLRAYIDSSFFGQWYYATMLSLLGIKESGETLGVQKSIDYFMNAVEFLADWYDYALYDGKKFGLAPFMCSVVASGHLDNIGTMGVNFIEAYQRTGDKRYLPLINTLRQQIRHEVSRFPDGTFCRKASGTMWADDFYMSNPFLVRLYSKMGDESALEDILCQLKGFKERLYMPDEKIFSHIYFIDKGVKNSIPWGRGNGWILFAMSEVLMHVPKDNPAHKIMRDAFCEFCEGLASVQDECGLWHQILNRPESYLETSCTAMFSLAFMRGVNRGWLPEKFMENAERGLRAILEKCVDRDGVVYGVCMGSSCSMDAKYYFDLTTIKDDNHGTGIVLMLLNEKLMAEKEKKISVKDNK